MDSTCARLLGFAGGDIKELGAAMLEEAFAQLGGDHGELWEYEETSGGLRELARSSEVEEMLDQDMRQFAQRAVHNPEGGESLILAPEANALHILSARKSIRREMTTGVLLVPLVADGRSMGALYVGSRGQTAFEVKPGDEESLRLLGETFGQLLQLHRQLVQLRLQRNGLLKEQSHDEDVYELPGHSEAIERVRNAVLLVASTDIPVTLVGKPGTGRRKAAEAIHRLSGRANKPLVTLPLERTAAKLHEGLLFGQRAGDPHAPPRGRRGVLREAHGGTLVLRHVDLLDESLQRRMLAVLEAGEIVDRDEEESYPVDVRLVFLTAEDPRTLFERGAVTQDLHRKLSLFPVLVPSLKERLEDLPELVQEYLQAAAGRFGKRIKDVASEVYSFLAAAEWPENLDQLEREVQEAALRTPDRGILAPGMLSQRVLGVMQPGVQTGGEGTLKQRLARIEKRMIIEALEEYNHNQSLTAEKLGLSRQALINKFHRYGIETGRNYKRKQREISKRAQKKKGS